MRRAVPLSVVLCWGWLSMPALAVDTEHLLQKLAQSEQQTSFTGTFVYGVADSLSTHKVWHLADRGEFRERILRLDGVAGQVIRAGGAIECSSDESASEVVSGRSWQRSALDPNVLRAGYDIRPLGETRVAGRAVDSLALVPRDHHRYGLDLHLDQETGVPLKALLRGADGRLLTRHQYTEFTPGEVAREAIAAAGDCARVHSRSDDFAQADVPWAAEWIPPGFRLQASGTRAIEAGGQLSWLTYGDGLARFTAFIEPVTGLAPSDERSELGATSVISKRVASKGQDLMVTVVGEIPLGTAERIALSMRQTETSQ